MKLRNLPLLTAVICALLAGSPISHALENQAPASEEALRNLLEGSPANRKPVRGQRIDWSLVSEFYRKRAFRPAWSGFANNDRVDEALSVLDGVRADGFLPSDYYAMDLRDLRKELLPVDMEVALSSAMLRYTRDRYLGRADLGRIDSDIALPAVPFDPAQALSEAVDAMAKKGSLVLPEPASPGYAALKKSLQRYLEIMRNGGWPNLTEFAAPGEDAASPRNVQLGARLAVEETDATLRQSEISVRVKAFQESHGLEVDGVIGPQTRKALNITVSQRVDQIRANMERWRWVGVLSPDSVRVNIPSAELTLYRANNPVLTSRIIVGKPANPTPIFSASISGVVVNPPWDIPNTIATKEILPKARRSPGYLARQHIITTDDGHLRQLPGPDNALGVVKLDMPNRFSTYLHDTPARSLFSKHSRFFSHGCMRVEKVRELAANLLGDDETVMLARLNKAISSGETQRIPLKKNVPVYVLYWTAIARQGGDVTFLPDIYGRDARLLDAIQAARADQYTWPSRDGCD